jgi:hypothetical protein
MDLLKTALVLPVAVLCGAATACVPDVDVDESLITAPRVIAITAEPAEARENQKVTYSALLVDKNGVREEGVLVWFQCSARLPLSELSPISSACLDPNTAENLKFGSGPSATVAVPPNACSLFGPNPPAPAEGEDPGRPVDADATGGYKLPIVLGVRATTDEDVVIYEQRLTCNLSGAPAATSAEFRSRYQLNTNPRIRAIRVRTADGDELSAGDDGVLAVEAGAPLTLEAEVPACPDSDSCGDGICGIDETRSSCAEDCSTPKGCGGSERYLRYDPGSRTLVEERESLRFAWYATAGKLDDERTGISAGSTSRRSANAYTVPAAAGEHHVFVVARDARGGVGHAEITLRVP